VCDKTCIFCFFPITNKYLCMAKRSLLSERPSYISAPLPRPQSGTNSFLHTFHTDGCLLAMTLSCQWLSNSVDSTSCLNRLKIHHASGRSPVRTCARIQIILSYKVGFLTACRQMQGLDLDTAVSSRITNNLTNVQQSE
jgi:hypothetical protein